MKKLIALALGVLMAVSLAACAQEPAATDLTTVPQTEPSTQPSVEPETQPIVLPPNFDPAACGELFGTWQTTIVLDGSLMNLTDMEGSTFFTVTYTFDAFGQYAISLDETEFTTAIGDYKSLLSAHMVESLYAKFTAERKLEGMKKSKIQAAWEESGQAEAQATADDFVAALDLEGRFAPISRAGDYYVEEGRLYIRLESGGYESCGFALEEGKLVLSDTDNAAFYRPLCLTFPLSLTKPVTE